MHEYISTTESEFSGLIFNSEGADNILSIYGISGPHQAEKAKMITYCFMVQYSLCEQNKDCNYSEIDTDTLELNNIYLNEIDFLKIKEFYKELRNVFIRQ